MGHSIKDFGEKIGGAKKDIWRNRRFTIEDLKSLDATDILTYCNKQTIWPNDYQQYKGKMTDECIYVLKNIRDKVPSKLGQYNTTDTRNELDNKAKKYIKFVEIVRDQTEKIKTIADVIPTIDVIINTLVDEFRRMRYVRKLEVSLIDICRRLPDIVFEAKAQAFPDEFRMELKGIRVASMTKDGETNFYITNQGKPISTKQFATKEEAEEYGISGGLRAEIDGKEKKKKINRVVTIVRPQLEHIERRGPLYRKYRDAKSEHLLTVYRFRGGEFGNWNTDYDRQAVLNYAFDGLLDLAYVLNYHNTALSLGYEGSNIKKLGIAFGARGSGKSIAWYEPDRVVMNITKIRGAGSLAHEFGHALDNVLGAIIENRGYYLSFVHLNKDKYLSEEGTHKNEDKTLTLKYQLIKTMCILKRQMIYGKIPNLRVNGKSKFYRDALELDVGRQKPYYASSNEMFARCFESYVQDKLEERGITSQYLVHSTKNKYYGGYSPYPQGEERKELNKAMEVFLAEIKSILRIPDFDEKIKRYYEEAEYISYIENNIVITLQPKRNRIRSSNNSDGHIIDEFRAKIKEEAEKIARNIYKDTKRVINKDNLADALKRSNEFTQVGVVDFGERKLQATENSHSKSFKILNGNGIKILCIDKRAKDEKIVEALIENLVDIEINKITAIANISYIRQAIKYGLCVAAGLDVRTYLRSNRAKVEMDTIRNLKGEKVLNEVFSNCVLLIDQIIRNVVNN